MRCFDIYLYLYSVKQDATMKTKTKAASTQRRAIGDYSRERVEEAYKEVISSLGKHARYYPKLIIYDMVAKKVGLSQSHVQRVMLKK